VNRRLTAAAALVTVGLLTAACAQSVTGTAVPDPSSSLADLNTGGFSTTPRKVTTSPAQQRVLAANLLADKMVFPWSIDSALTNEQLNTNALVQPSNLSLTVDQTTLASLTTRGILYGYTSARADTANPTTKALIIGLWRMTDDAAAKGAVNDERTRYSSRLVSLPGKPDTVAARLNDSIESMTAIGPLLVYVWAKAPDVATQTDYVNRTIDAQRTMLNGFTAPDLSGVSQLPADRDSIVSYTVEPEPIAEGRFEPEYGFKTAHAQLHNDDEPIQSAQLFDESGMDLVGIGRNHVYRFRDEAGAQHLMDAWMDLIAKRDGAQRATVTGLPAAKCYTFNISSGVTKQPYTSCYVTVGRYMSEYSDPNADKAEQVTSAAYLVLRQAK
jgi:hypothetical protein